MKADEKIALECAMERIAWKREQAARERQP